MKSCIVPVIYVQLNADECERLKASVVSKTHLSWGTMGPNLDEPCRDIPLCELATDHLENILITQVHIGAETRAIILHILKGRYREEKDC